MGLLEYGHVEPTSFTQLARTGRTAVGMHVATGGDVRRSRRMQELVQSCLGCTDELRILASAGGQVWGGVALFRDNRSAPYREEDVEFVSSLSGYSPVGCEWGCWLAWPRSRRLPRPPADLR